MEAAWASLILGMSFLVIFSRTPQSKSAGYCWSSPQRFSTSSREKMACMQERPSLVGVAFWSITCRISPTISLLAAVPASSRYARITYGAIFIAVGTSKRTTGTSAR